MEEAKWSFSSPIKNLAQAEARGYQKTRDQEFQKLVALRALQSLEQDGRVNLAGLIGWINPGDQTKK